MNPFPQTWHRKRRSSLWKRRLFAGEAFPADAAGEGFLAAVNLQVPALVEGLPAEVAAVGFLSGVAPQVHLQRGVGAERLPAHVTRAAAAAHVRAQVRGQAGAGLMLVATEAAATVRSSQVTLGMRHQSCSLVERVSTDLAAVRLCGIGEPLTGLLGSVRAAVGLEVSHQAELLPTDAAAERSLSRVQPCVQLLGQGGPEGVCRRASSCRSPGAAADEPTRRVRTLAIDAAEPIPAGGTNLEDMLEQVCFARAESDRTPDTGGSRLAACAASAPSSFP